MNFITQFLRRQSVREPAAAVPSAPDLGRPERPIELIGQDKLSRMPFVKRLASALVSQSGKATGVVIGITGQWGSGKSSLLNLLRRHLKDTHPDAVVVSFDPWLISGRNDLISEFIAELIAALKPRGRFGMRFRSLTKSLVAYGKVLSPAANLMHPGLGAVSHGGFEIADRVLKGDQSLQGFRKKLTSELAKAAVPIIVLIDELDRVEDREIRMTAQLVRAIVDFPGISYVLAYDPERVIQALGEGAPDGEREKRGSAYLEKIVQLQIPLPLTLDAEITRMLTAELAKLPAEVGLPAGFDGLDRYRSLMDALACGAIQTPRDVSRLVGTFHALAGMVDGEVDALDLLCYAALLVKSPRTVAGMRRQPEELVEDAIAPRAVIRRIGSQKLTLAQRLAEIVPEDGDQPGTNNLLGFLFPVLSQDERYKPNHPNRLCLRRPLMTVLRLGLLPGFYSQSEIEALVRMSPEEIAAKLYAAYKDESLGALMDRLDDLYSGFVDMDHVSFWKGVAKFVRKSDCEWMRDYQPMHEVINNLGGVLRQAIVRNPKFRDIATRVFLNLRNADEDVLTARWLRDHVFAFGLFGNDTNRKTDDTFLNSDQTAALVRDMSIGLRPKHIMGQLIPCRWDLMPIYSMIDAGIWDDECRKKLDDVLVADAALDGLTLMFYGGQYSTGRETVGKFCSYDKYKQRVQQRLSSNDFMQADETVRLALGKALDPF